MLSEEDIISGTKPTEPEGFSQTDEVVVYISDKSVVSFAIPASCDKVTFSQKFSPFAKTALNKLINALNPEVLENSRCAVICMHVASSDTGDLNEERTIG